jgi:hypothetical protein
LLFALLVELTSIFSFSSKKIHETELSDAELQNGFALYGPNGRLYAYDATSPTMRCNATDLREAIRYLTYSRVVDISECKTDVARIQVVYSRIAVMRRPTGGALTSEDEVCLCYYTLVSKEVQSMMAHRIFQVEWDRVSLDFDRMENVPNKSSAVG